MLELLLQYGQQQIHNGRRLVCQHAKAWESLDRSTILPASPGGHIGSPTLSPEPQDG